MIGASAAISGQMAAAIRFVFELGGPLGAIRRSDRAAYFVPAQPLADCFRNQQVLVFVAVWFGLNLFFGIMSGPVAGQPASVACKPILAGLLLASRCSRFWIRCRDDGSEDCAEIPYR